MNFANNNKKKALLPATAYLVRRRWRGKAVQDAKCNFIMLNVGQYSSNNDSGVLINSLIGQKFEENSFDLPAVESLEGCPAAELPYYLVGDESFPLKLWHALYARILVN